MNVGLVLSGGFARGAAQLGFIKALCEKIGRNSIKLISSSSIGCVNSLAISANCIDKLACIYCNSDFKNITDFKNRLRHNFLNDTIDKLLSDETSNIEIPFYVTGTCLNKLSTHYFLVNNTINRDELKKILDISTTFPFVNGVMKKAFNNYYIDGGATDNIPVFPFLINNVDVLLILHCSSTYLPPQQIVNSNKIVIDVDVTAKCGDVSSFGVSKKNLTFLYNNGYGYGESFCKTVLSSDDIEKIKKNGQQFMQSECKLRQMKKKNFFNLVSILNKVQSSRGFLIDKQD